MSRLLLLIIFSVSLRAENNFTVPKKNGRTSVAKMKEDIGESYASIIKRISQLNCVLVDCLEPLLDGASLKQELLKTHRDLIEKFEFELQKFETAMHEYKDELTKTKDA